MLRLTNHTLNLSIGYALIHDDGTVEQRTLLPGRHGDLVRLALHDDGSAVGRGAHVPEGHTAPPTIVLHQRDLAHCTLTFHEERPLQP